MPSMRFVEDVNFTRQVQSIKADECLRELQEELAANPLKGDLVKGTGGFRKIRMRMPGAAKAAAQGLCTCIYSSALSSFFSTSSPNAGPLNISDAGKAVLRQAAAEIKAHQGQFP